MAEEKVFVRGDRFLNDAEFGKVLEQYGLVISGRKIISAPEGFDWGVFDHTPIRINSNRNGFTPMAHAAHRPKEPNWQKW